MTKEQREQLHRASLTELASIYVEVWRQNDIEVIRDFILNDRFFLLTQVLAVDVAWHPWVLERCREVEADPDEKLDVWSRGHFKSTIITYAGTTQEILRNPEICICIMSYKAGAADAFAEQIKSAFERNPILLRCFPDILWVETPKHQGPVWSNNGFNVKRNSNRKENTVNTSGLISGMRTGGHYDLLIYDDTVTYESVITPEMSKRTTDAWSMSLNLGSTNTRHWYIGTRYAIYDTYATMIARGIKERRHICIDSSGNPVYLSQKEFNRKHSEMSAKDWASQMLQSPIGLGELVFNDDWWLYWVKKPDVLNIYIFVDTATTKRKNSDYTVMWVVGLARDKNYYILDCVRDKLSLSQRADAIFDLVERWQPINVFWEANGSRSDGEYLKEQMQLRAWRFRITEINQRLPKDDRIRWLEPQFRNGKIFMPTRLLYQQVTGEMVDLIHIFRTQEYACYPSVVHDDMLDCLANIKHPDVLPQLCFPMLGSSEHTLGNTNRNTAKASMKRMR